MNPFTATGRLIPRMAHATDGEAKEPLDVYQLVTIMLEQMAAVSWQKLGLQPDMITGTIVKNLDQAKVGIDVTTALAGFLEPQLDEEDRRHIHSLLRDLKINFVQQTQGGGA